jgi:hypothetical protein
VGGGGDGAVGAEEVAEFAGEGAGSVCLAGDEVEALVDGDAGVLEGGEESVRAYTLAVEVDLAGGSAVVRDDGDAFSAGRVDAGQGIGWDVGCRAWLANQGDCLLSVGTIGDVESLADLVHGPPVGISGWISSGWIEMWAVGSLFGMTDVVGRAWFAAAGGLRIGGLVRSGVVWSRFAAVALRRRGVAVDGPTRLGPDPRRVDAPRTSALRASAVRTGALRAGAVRTGALRTGAVGAGAVRTGAVGVGAVGIGDV